jgi:hypothetical protein
MDVNEFINQINRVTYKPGVKIIAYNHISPTDGKCYVMISITHRRPDVDNYPETSKIVILNRYIAERIEDAPESFAMSELQALLIKAETHAMHEWLKLDDVHVTQPHPKRKQP